MLTGWSRVELRWALSCAELSTAYTAELGTSSNTADVVLPPAVRGAAGGWCNSQL